MYVYIVVWMAVWDENAGFDFHHVSILERYIFVIFFFPFVFWCCPFWIGTIQQKLVISLASSLYLFVYVLTLVFVLWAHRAIVMNIPNGNNPVSE